MSRLPKGRAYPIERCSLEAAVDVAEAHSLRQVTFQELSDNHLLQAIYQGSGRRNSKAGTCSLSIGSVPARAADRFESLVLLEGIPQFLRWLKRAERAAVKDPKNVFFWTATLVNDKLSFSSS
jgi:hypothetical protein